MFQDSGKEFLKSLWPILESLTCFKVTETIWKFHGETETVLINREGEMVLKAVPGFTEEVLEEVKILLGEFPGHKWLMKRFLVLEGLQSCSISPVVTVTCR